MSTLEQFRLTRRVCTRLRPIFRARSDELWNTAQTRQAEYSACKKIARCLDTERDANTKRGGVSIDLTVWSALEATLLRDLLLVVLKGCAQIQVRRSIQVRVQQLDDHIGTSAVEVLGRLTDEPRVGMKVAS